MATDPTEIFVRELLTDQRIFGIEQGNRAAVRIAAATEALRVALREPQFDYLANPQFESYSFNGEIREVDLPLSEVQIPDDVDLLTPNANVNRGRTTFGLGLSDDPPEVDHRIGNYQRPVFADRFDEEAPDVDTNIEIPPVPNYPIPELSDITNPVLPEAPIITIPDRQLSRPEFNGTIPEDAAQNYLEIWEQVCAGTFDKIDMRVKTELCRLFPNHDFMSAKLDEYLCASLAGDETAYSDALEEQIYTRAKNRADNEVFKQREEVYDLARQTSNPIMPLRVRAGLLRTTENAASQLVDVNVAIAQQRADREIEQTRFIVDKIVELRRLYIDTRQQEISNIVAINGQALDAASKFVDTLFREFDALIQVFEVELKIFDAELQELQDKRQYALTELEVYKQRLEAARLESQFNSQLLEQDKLSIDILTTLYSVYDSQIRAIQAEAELRKLPIEIFSEKVSAYAAYVQAIRGETEVFNALVNSDVEIIRSQVEQVRAWAVGKDVQLKELDRERLDLEKIQAYNEAQTSLFNSKATIEQLKLDVRNQDLQVQKIGIDTDIEKFRAESQAELERFRSTNEFKLNVTQLNIRYTEAIERIFMSYNEVLVAQASAIAQTEARAADVYGRIGASAMNGVNELVSVNVSKTIEDN